MFIELAEMLRCPGPHEETFLVVATETMARRSVRRGVVGCPACGAEYPVEHGVVRFGEPPPPREWREVTPVDTLHALLGLGGPGGYVVLLGTPARRARELADLLEGVHLIGVNAPPDVQEAQELSLVRAEATIPLRREMARGVVVGSEFAHPPWLEEAVRVALRGRHVVVEREGIEVAGAATLASGLGLWLGQRR